MNPYQPQRCPFCPGHPAMTFNAGLLIAYWYHAECDTRITHVPDRPIFNQAAIQDVSDSDEASFPVL